MRETLRTVVPAIAFGVSSTLLFQHWRTYASGMPRLLPRKSKGIGSVLLTGGAGYIATHVLVELLTLNYDVVIVDNLCNSSQESIRRVETITGKSTTFYNVDIRDKVALREVFAQEGPFDIVMHFAGLKAVGQSTKNPLTYYDNNVGGTVALVQVMEEYACYNLVFSSSATVYGTAPVPYDEEATTGVGISNPYGKTKYVVEEMLKDLVESDGEVKNWNVSFLRYFNPIGAHESGLIGEDPQGIPNNLMPYVAQVCIGRRPQLTVHGNDYDTKDGTGTRDYIHVVDLAKGHIAALRKMLSSAPECRIYNLGCGEGFTVLDVVHQMEDASGSKVSYVIGPRRPGDLPVCFALTNKAFTELHWKTEKSLHEMCKDTWNWQLANPNGYSS